jgi:hypothetical protein
MKEDLSPPRILWILANAKKIITAIFLNYHITYMQFLGVLQLQETMIIPGGIIS